MGLGLGVGLRFRLGLGFGLEDTVGRVRHLHQHGLAQVEVLVAHHVEDGEEDKRHVDAVEEDAWGWAGCMRVYVRLTWPWLVYLYLMVVRRGTQRGAASGAWGVGAVAS